MGSAAHQAQPEVLSTLLRRLALSISHPASLGLGHPPGDGLPETREETLEVGHALPEGRQIVTQGVRPGVQFGVQFPDVLPQPSE